MKGTWAEYDHYMVHGGVYAIEKPDYSRESEDRLGMSLDGVEDPGAWVSMPDRLKRIEALLELIAAHFKCDRRSEGKGE